MTAGHSKNRAGIVSSTVMQIVAKALSAWAHGDQPDGDLATARDEIEALLRDEFQEIARQARDEITLAD